jgi:hypothetical protein
MIRSRADKVAVPRAGGSGARQFAATGQATSGIASGLFVLLPPPEADAAGTATEPR